MTFAVAQAIAPLPPGFGTTGLLGWAAPSPWQVERAGTAATGGPGLPRWPCGREKLAYNGAMVLGWLLPRTPRAWLPEASVVALFQFRAAHNPYLTGRFGIGGHTRAWKGRRWPGPATFK